MLATNNHKLKLEWTRLTACLCAAGAIGAALWLLPDVHQDRVDSMNGDSSRETKSRGREERGIHKKNPLKEFETARMRGMTEKEVRKVLGEYFEAVAFSDQPGRPLEELLLDLRLKRLNLYLGALTEGFGLTEEQKLDAQAKLPALAAEQVSGLLILESVDREWNLSLIGAGGEIPEQSPLSRSEQIEVIARNPISLTDEGIRPWELCELNDRQKDMIRYQDDAGEWIWVDGGEKTFDFGTKESYVDLSDPYAEDAEVIATAGQIFPLSMWQLERMGDLEDEAVSSQTTEPKRGIDLKRVKLLTPPQLKTLLLFSPEMPARLMQDLEGQAKPLSLGE